KYEREEETDIGRLVVAEITTLDVVRERAVKSVEIRLRGKGLAKSLMRDLATLLDRYPGDRRVSVVVEINGGPTLLRVRAATARRIRPSDHFIRDVEALCGRGARTLP